MTQSSAKRALISIDDLTSIKNIAKRLHGLGWEIVATAETVAALKGSGVVVTSVDRFTGFDKRYEFPGTLHPTIERSLTFDCSSRIDIVYDVPYYGEGKMDVGGLALLALGIKGGRIVCSSRDDIERVLKELEDKGEVTEELKSRLINKALFLISSYYAVLMKGSDYSIQSGKLSGKLLNGENPYQNPAFLYSNAFPDRLALAAFKNVTGAPPCLVNFSDFDAILHSLVLVSQAFQLNIGKVPNIAIAAKHGNPCGLAVHYRSPALAIKNALMGNPRAVWGGEYLCNFSIDSILAKKLYESKDRDRLYGNRHWMLDVIGAPSFDRAAIEILGKKKNRKLLSNVGLKRPSFPKGEGRFRAVRGGFIKEPFPDYIVDFKKVTSTGKFSAGILPSAIIAWAAAYSSFHGGNEVALARDGMLLSVGGGPSTVEAAETAISRAKSNGHSIEGSIFAADAFFPFTDAPELLVSAGCSYGIVPEGGRRDEDIKVFFSKAGVNMLYLPEPCRGFIRH